MNCSYTKKDKTQCRNRGKYEGKCHIHRYIGKIYNQKEQLYNLQRTVKDLKKEVKLLTDELRTLTKENTNLVQRLDELQSSHRQISTQLHRYNNDRRVVVRFEKFKSFAVYLHNTLFQVEDYNIYNLCNNQYAEARVQSHYGISLNKFIDIYEETRLERNRICHPKF